MLQSQPRTPGRETATPNIPAVSHTTESLDQSQIHEDVCLLIHSNDGRLRCLVAGDGTWVSVTDRESNKHTTTPLKVCQACKHGLVSDDGTYIILVDIDDGIWLHHVDKKWTGRIQLPCLLLSEFDTVLRCHATANPDVYVIVTERRLILCRSDFILDSDTPKTRTTVQLCIQGFESDVVAVSGPHKASERGQEYVIVQTEQNCYIGTIEGEDSVLLALYEDLDDGSVICGNSIAMATSESGHFVALAMQGKEVHVWNIHDLMESYEEYGVIQGVTPIILDGFEEDITMLFWSMHAGSVHLVTSGSGRMCMVWDFDTIGSEKLSIRDSMTCPTESCIIAGCFHPGSDVLSLLQDDGTLCFFNTSPFLSGGTKSRSGSICTNRNPIRPSLLWEDGDDGRLFLLLSNNLVSWETRDLMHMLPARNASVEITYQDSTLENISLFGPETPVTVPVNTSMSPSPFSSPPCPEMQNLQMGCIQPWDQAVVHFGSPPPYMPHGQGFSTVWMREHSNFCPAVAASPPSPVFWRYGPVSYSESYPCSPPAQHPAESTVYIGNIPSELQEDSISWICSQYGQVFDVQIIKDSHLSLGHKGYAFVTFSHPTMAQRCIHELNGQLIHGANGSFKIRVAPSRRQPFKHRG